MEIILKVFVFLMISAVIIGISYKLFQIVIKALAAPALIGFIILERFHGIRWLTLNKSPKSSDAKMWRNIFASIISIFVFYNGKLFVYALISSWQTSDEIVFRLNMNVSTIVTCFILPTIGLFLINAFCEKDEDDSFTKLSKYDVTGLLKFIGKFG